MQKDHKTSRIIRVLLADDHTMFRQGLSRLLVSHGGLEVVGEVPNDEEALALAQEEKPDVVVMQVQMPFERAKESLLKMSQISSPPKVVVVTMFEEPRYVRELMRLGASAYLLKSVSIEHLTGAVRAAVFDPEGQHVVVGRGLSNRQVGSSLRLSETTVKRHLANAYPKMGVASRGEALRKALSEGWITIQDITQEEEK